MRQIFNSLDLRINYKIYYNLFYDKLLEDRIFNNLFKNLVLILKKMNFYFTYLISNKLANNNNIKKYILK